MFTPLTPIRCLHRAMDLYGRKEGVVCGERRFTYAEFGERCQRLAAALEAAGLELRDRVAYLSFNTHQLLEGYFGVVLAGGIFMPLNVRLSAVELADILNRSRPKFLLFESGFIGFVSQFRLNCSSVEMYLPLEDEYEEFLLRSKPGRKDIYTTGENSIAEIFYTSGTDGSPKGVALSHRALYLHALSVASAFHQDDTTVHLHTVPLFHANGWGCVHAGTLMGAKHVLLRRFGPAAAFRLIETERVTSMTLVPTMARMLLDAPELGMHDLSSLREIHMGGAASAPELIDRMEQAFGCLCMSGYGLTETSPVACSARPKEGRPGMRATAGWPVLGMEVRIVDAGSCDVARDGVTVGEILIRGDHVMEGYFCEPEATESVMTDGWLRTGDLGVWDEESYVQITDRQKDLVISGGENISSLEVERAIAAHPAVVECAVVAMPDERWGETPVAFVVAREPVDGDQLRAFLEPRLARFKIPRRFEFVDEPLPKTGLGKILKRELRERLRAGADNKTR